MYRDARKRDPGLNGLLNRQASTPYQDLFSNFSFYFPCVAASYAELVSIR